MVLQNRDNSKGETKPASYWEKWRSDRTSELRHGEAAVRQTFGMPIPACDVGREIARCQKQMLIKPGRLVASL